MKLRQQFQFGLMQLSNMPSPKRKQCLSLNQTAMQQRTSRHSEIRSLNVSREVWRKAVSRELDDPNELVGQRRRRRIGSGQTANQPATEGTSTLENQQVDTLASQPSNMSTTQQA